MDQYIEFLRGKIQVAPETGLAVDAAQVCPALKPHQRDAVVWACRQPRENFQPSQERILKNNESLDKFLAELEAKDGGSG